MSYTFDVKSAKLVETNAYNTEKSHVIISLLSPSDRKMFNIVGCENTKDILYIDVDDINQETKDKILFTAEHAKQILAFVEKYKDDVDYVLVHCLMGQSRSAGCAAVLSEIYNGDDFYYFKFFTPNTHIYRTIYNTYNEMLETQKDV